MGAPREGSILIYPGTTRRARRITERHGAKRGGPKARSRPGTTNATSVPLRVTPWPPCRDLPRAKRGVALRSGDCGAAGCHHVLVQVLREEREEVEPGVAPEDAVVPVGVLHHLERLVRRHQPVHERLAVLVVHVVVARPVDEQQVAAE